MPVNQAFECHFASLKSDDTWIHAACCMMPILQYIATEGPAGRQVCCAEHLEKKRRRHLVVSTELALIVMQFRLNDVMMCCGVADDVRKWGWVDG